MAHVIEHLSEPLATLQWIFSHLKPGGRLLLTTPVCGTLTAWFGGEAWFHMTEHVQYFTPHSLCRLGRRCGLSLLYNRTLIGVETETTHHNWRRLLLGGSLERLLQDLGHGDVIDLVLEKK